MPSNSEAPAIEQRVQRLTCREVVELITSYLEDALDETEREHVARHLSRCKNCATYLDQIRQTAVWLSHLSSNGLTADVKNDLLTRFREWCAERR